MAEERDLERQAVEELLREAGRGRVRAQTMGPAGWMKCPLRGANKRFLLNTLRTVTRQGRTLGAPQIDQSRIRRHDAESKSQRHPSREAQHSKSRNRSPSAQRSRDRSRSPVKSYDSDLKSSSPTPEPLDSTLAAKAHHSHPKSWTGGCVDLQ